MNTLCQAVEEYLTLRRSLGFKLYKAGKLLPTFVKFMEERRASYITSKLALTWAQQPSAVQPGPVTLSRLCASDVVRFVQRQAPRLHTKTAKLMTTALRSFLQYARYLGEVTLDLAAAVPIVANWSMTSIPRAISTEHVRQLLASIDRRTAVGRRDYAILLLLARLGLRAGEVASL